MSSPNIILKPKRGRPPKKVSEIAEESPKKKSPKSKVTQKKTNPQKKQIKKKTLAQMQRENPQDIIVPVGIESKCPKGTRKKDGKCILTKEFKDTFLKRKACIQNYREELDY